MDRIEKALKKLTPKERVVIRTVLMSLKNQQLDRLDLKKLKGRDDIFRIRKGQIRILYRTGPQGAISILAIERRGDTTYTL